MIEVLEKYLCIFFIYSFLGWVMEMINGYIQTKKIVNRGFLIGPYCPIYGVGVGLVTAFLSKYVNDIPIMFFMSMLICGLLEYFTSYIMEKIFKARWWDYSNRKFNINGRICLETLIPFGIAGVVLVKYANPFFLQILDFNFLKYVLLALILIFIIDFSFSFKGVLGFRKATKQVEKEVKDNTEEISIQMKELALGKYEELKNAATKKAQDIQEATSKTIDKIKQGASEKIIEAKEKIKERLVRYENEKTANKLLKEKVSEKSWITRRLLDAFPNLQVKFKNKKDKK